jgi:glycosyltransferase involved in cell wall biosynthesis
MYKISVLTACHNDAKFIAACAKSILSQNDLYEWVVVDDNSTDTSYSILTTFKDKRIKLLRNIDQKYCSSTYARALNSASGDICAIVDGDDAIVPGAISSLGALYKKHPTIDFIYTQHWWCDKKLKKQRTGISSSPGPKSLSRAALTGKHCFSHWRTFKRKLSDRATIFPDGLKCSVDKNMGFVLERIGQGGFYNHPLYLYRYYKENMSLTMAKLQKTICRALAQQYEKESQKCHRIKTL